MPPLTPFIVLIPQLCQFWCCEKSIYIKISQNLIPNILGCSVLVYSQLLGILPDLCKYIASTTCEDLSFSKLIYI